MRPTKYNQVILLFVQIFHPAIARKPLGVNKTREQSDKRISSDSHCVKGRRYIGEVMIASEMPINFVSSKGWARRGDATTEMSWLEFDRFFFFAIVKFNRY